MIEPVMVYVAGPYTNPDPVANTHKAIEEADWLLDNCYEGSVIPVVPHLSLMWHLLTPRDVDFWYSYDLEILKRCDVLLRIPGESTGADKEVEFAKAHDIGVWRDTDQLAEHINESGMGVKMLRWED